MKSHYCPEEKGEVQYEGQCNWCGEKENQSEPVAWMYENHVSTNMITGGIPLYTTPQKKLSDEGIKEIIKKVVEKYHVGVNWDFGFDVARAIEAKVRGEK
jgi:4-hydroxy-L-threonine phosphate dehydrogenase PdxA